jgi:hypothetical protein
MSIQNSTCCTSFIRRLFPCLNPMENDSTRPLRRSEQKQYNSTRELLSNNLGEKVPLDPTTNRSALKYFQDHGFSLLGRDSKDMQKLFSLRTFKMSSFPPSTNPNHVVFRTQDSDSLLRNGTVTFHRDKLTANYTFSVLEGEGSSEISGTLKPQTFYKVESAINNGLSLFMSNQEKTENTTNDFSRNFPQFSTFILMPLYNET